MSHGLRTSPRRDVQAERTSNGLSVWLRAKGGAMSVSTVIRITIATVCLVFASCSDSSKERLPLCGDGGTAVEASSVTVADLSFAPQCITVRLGTTVTWTNTGLPIHTVTSEPNAAVAFDSGPLGQDGVFSFTFNQTGVVDYSSAPYQGQGMVGTVIVR